MEMKPELLFPNVLKVLFLFYFLKFKITTSRLTLGMKKDLVA